MKEAEREAIEAALGHHFRQPEWLQRALTHRSWAGSAGVNPHLDNERLEFLGDRVLGLIVAQHLWREHSDWDAGMLSKAKARLVSTLSVQKAAQRVGLGRHLRLGRGEEKTGGREKRNLLADAYEAVVAAIYVDGGFDAAAGFVKRSLLDAVVAAESGFLNEADHKSALQEWLQKRGLGKADYRVVKESGPDHQKVFWVELWLAGSRMAASQAGTKKEAEQAAARSALDQLRKGSETTKGE